MFLVFLVISQVVAGLSNFVDVFIKYLLSFMAGGYFFSSIPVMSIPQKGVIVESGKRYVIAEDRSRESGRFVTIRYPTETLGYDALATPPNPAGGFSGSLLRCLAT